MAEPKKRRKFVHSTSASTHYTQPAPPPPTNMGMGMVLGGRLEQRLIIAQSGRPDMKERRPLIIAGIPDE